jgi:hypothetical protein
MKQAYERFVDGLHGWEYQKIELLPECKRVTRVGETKEYQKVRSNFLGIPYTRWVDKRYIVFFDKETVEYYACSCGDKE